MEQVENKVVKEGGNVEVYCNVTAGIPDPSVLRTNVATGEYIEGNPLNITNSNRAQAGEYRCAANNTCGVDSIVVDIDVQRKNITTIVDKVLGQICTFGAFGHTPDAITNLPASSLAPTAIQC